MGGVKTVRLFYGENKYACHAFDSQGVKEYKDKDNNEEMMPQLPVVIIPNIEVGESITYSANFISNDLDGEGVSEDRVSVSIKFESMESMVVPAGKFPDCLKFSSSYIWKNSDGGISREEDIVFWLARGIGKVKEVSVFILHGDDGKATGISTETRDLISAVIDGKRIDGRQLPAGQADI